MNKIKLIPLVIYKWTFIVPPCMLLLGLWALIDVNEWVSYSWVVWLSICVLISIGAVHSILYRWQIYYESEKSGIYLKFFSIREIKPDYILVYKNSYIIKNPYQIVVVSSDDHEILDEFYSKLLLKCKNYPISFWQHLAIRYSFGLYKVKISLGTPK